MIKHIDHVTIAVTNLEQAIHFFTLLGFKEEHNVVIEGEPFATYMHIKNLKAAHVTMVQINAKPRFEIQLLHFYSPTPQSDAHIHRLDKIGYNHICFNVEDLEEEMKRLQSKGIRCISDVLDFNERKLVYFTGPDGIILELAQWKK